MQLTQIIRRTGTRAWIVAVVPALAVGALVFLVFSGPSTYNTSATVSVSSPSGSDTASTVTQNVDSFRSALTSEAVRDAAASSVDIEAVDERDLTSSRIGASNLVDITLTTAKADQGPELLDALVVQANQLLFTSEQNAANAQLVAAQESFDAAKSAVAVRSDDGINIPTERYRAKASEVTQLRVALATARARNEAGVTGLSTALKTAQNELNTLGAQVRDLGEISFEYTEALSQLGEAKTRATATEARLEGAISRDSIKLGDTTQESTQSKLAKAVVSGLLVSIAFALGLVLLLDLLRPQRQARRDRKDPPTTGKSSSGRSKLVASGSARR